MVFATKSERIADNNTLEGCTNLKVKERYFYRYRKHPYLYKLVIPTHFKAHQIEQKHLKHTKIEK